MPKKKKFDSRTKIHTPYRDSNGVRVPGVTTLTNIYDKPALVYWAWNLGTQGIDYRKFRDIKADVGTITHTLVKSRLLEEKPDLSDYPKIDVRNAKKRFKAYLEFENVHNIKSILVEKPLVSEIYHFGGTPDFYGEVDGKLALLDYKTSKRCYLAHKLQLAGYKILLEEHGYKVDICYILRFDEDGNFHPHEFTNLTLYEHLFLKTADIYPLYRKLKDK